MGCSALASLAPLFKMDNDEHIYFLQCTPCPSQTSCSRRKAVKALKEHQGDLINAIMAVS